MEYDPSDSSGTDDDLPPSHQARGGRGGYVTGNGRVAVGALPQNRIQSDMEIQIHQLEQEAYTSVLRAFKAQSDAITWEKESLITELRKELRVSDQEHRELLSMVNADDIIRRIREWRKAGGVQSGLINNAQSAHDPAPSPTVSASRKRKPSQSIPLSLNAPSPVLHSQPAATSMQPSTSAVKKGAVLPAKGKKLKSGPSVAGTSSMKSLQYPLTGSTGRVQAATEPVEAAPYDSLIGRKVMTRWPDDNNFYEAVITEHNALEGLHLLVYDINTDNETWEWVNLKEISPEDIRWEGEDPGVAHNVLGRGGRGIGAKKPPGHGRAAPGAGRGRGSLKNLPKKEFPPSQNGVNKKSIGDIKIHHTDTLIKEIERVFNSSHPDPLKMDEAKRALKEQEQALIDAIARLANASDGESDDGRDQGWRNHPYTRNQHVSNYDHDMAGEAMVGDAVASRFRHDDDDDI